MIKNRTKVKVAILIGTLGCLFLAILFLKPNWIFSQYPDTLNLLDTSTNRLIPVLLYSKNIDSGKNRKVVIIAHGHGIKNSEYSYISSNLAEQGYVVASVQYELPGDGETDISENAYKALKPVWEKTVKSILFAVRYLKNKHPNLDCQKLILIGHSRGGDVVMLFAQKYPELVSKVIALDNGHMPFFKTQKPKIFLLRGNNTTPDSDVLPTPEEQKEFNIELVELPDVSHLDMAFGTDDQKAEINRYIMDFIKKE